MMLAAISAPGPKLFGASWTTTARPVFRTEATSVSRSSGEIVSRSMISISRAVLLVEPVGRLPGHADHGAVGDQREVLAGSVHVGPADLQVSISSGTSSLAAW